jgi:hypothetical protein
MVRTMLANERADRGGNLAEAPAAYTIQTWGERLKTRRHGRGGRTANDQILCVKP